MRRTRAAYYRLTIGLASALFLASCGYHLQSVQRVNNLPLVMNKTAVVANDPYGSLVRDLKRAIDATNATVVSQVEQSTAVVHVLSSTTSKRVISVDNRNRPQAYGLRYKATFSLTAGDHTLLAPQSVAVSREYEFDPNAALAANSEAQRLLRSMRADLVLKIMRQLAAVGPSRPRHGHNSNNGSTRAADHDTPSEPAPQRDTGANNVPARTGIGGQQG